jgi:hypothetical protein
VGNVFKSRNTWSAANHLRTFRDREPEGLALTLVYEILQHPTTFPGDPFPLYGDQGLVSLHKDPRTTVIQPYIISVPGPRVGVPLLCDFYGRPGRKD